MKPYRWLLSLFCTAILTANAFAQQPRCVVIDQDAVGPAGISYGDTLVWSDDDKPGLDLQSSHADGCRLAQVSKLLSAAYVGSHSQRQKSSNAPGRMT